MKEYYIQMRKVLNSKLNGRIVIKQ